MPASTPAPAPRPAAPARPPARRVPFTFQCTDCETVEHRPTPALPEGWILTEREDDLFAYCDACAPGVAESRELLQ